MKSQFLLDPTITFLNHGSFGACPKPIFEDYQKWQLILEKEPVQFIQKTGAGYLKTSKLALAKYIGCDVDDFFFTQNPTIAINTIMRGLDLKPGDEILSTNHEYGAMDRTWHFYCKKTGAKYVQSTISFPIISKEKLLVEFWKGYTPKTKVIFINQISSATALIFPVKEICDKARELGLITIIDGAHTPGHIDLNIREMNPDYFTGTTHKWLLTPKGSSFLYVKKERQATFEPLIISWGYESDMPSHSQFLDENEYQGTRDISAFLTLPKALQFLEENSWKEKTTICKQLILEYYPKFCELVNSKPICPVSSEFLGQMCSIPINTIKPVELKELLFNKYNVEIPITQLNGDYYMRITLNAYNTIIDLEVLRNAIIDIIATTDLLIVK
jgi:isopenicillin-N epimerase